MTIYSLDILLFWLRIILNCLRFHNTVSSISFYGFYSSTNCSPHTPHIFCYCYWGVGVFLFVCFLAFWVLTPYQIILLAKYFLPFIELLFTLLIAYLFYAQEFLILMINLSIFNFLSMILMSYLLVSLTNSVSWHFPLIFSPKILCVLPLMLRLLKSFLS